MKDLIQAFSENIKQAIVIANASKIEIPSQKIENIVICGMGGSGIGGKIVAQWMYDSANVPVTLLQDYTVPAFVGANTLVIGSSYSGSTEETLAAIYEAQSKGAHTIGICSGGTLKAFCEKNNYHCIVVPGGNPPRTALAFSIVQLVHIFSTFGFMKKSDLLEFELSAQLIKDELDLIQKDALILAKFIQGKVPVIYSASLYEGIAIRARQQFNENGKLLCWHHVIPEMNHNELVGWGGGDQRFVAVILQTNDYLPKNQVRLKISEETISKKTSILEVVAKGNSMIQKSIYLIHLVDWASFYLSELNAVDPMDIKIIDFLKSELSKH